MRMSRMLAPVMRGRAGGLGVWRPPAKMMTGAELEPLAVAVMGDLGVGAGSLGATIRLYSFVGNILGV